MKTENQENQDTPQDDEFIDTVIGAEDEVVDAVAPGAHLDPDEQIALLKDAVLRGKADFANLQRRAATQRAEAVRFANADLLKSLLVALDDFDRTIDAAAASEDPKSVLKGVSLVHANLTKALKENGLEEINALHESFDPTVHEALLQQPTDEFAPGTIVEQVAKGYRLRDRVLRPAKVIVAKATEESTKADANE